MHEITNRSNGPRFIHSKTGPVIIDPGQTATVDLADGQLDHPVFNARMEAGEFEIREAGRKAAPGVRAAVQRGQAETDDPAQDRLNPSRSSEADRQAEVAALGPPRRDLQAEEQAAQEAGPAPADANRSGPQHGYRRRT